MFTALELKGFKSWRELPKTRLAPITVFFGSNSSGKTSLLQSLLLVKQSAENRGRQPLYLGNAPGSLVDFESVFSLIHHERRSPLEIGLFWIATAELREDEDRRTNADHVALTVGKAGTLNTTDGPRSHAHALAERRYHLVGQVEQDEFVVQSISYSGYETGLSVKATRISIGSKEAGKYELTGFPSLARKHGGRHWPLPSLVGCVGFPDEIERDFKDGQRIRELEVGFREQLRKIRYIGPLREYPKSGYQDIGVRPDTVGRRGERAIEVLISAQNDGGKRSGDAHRLTKRVGEGLEQLGVVEKFELLPLARGSRHYELHVQVPGSRRKVSIVNVGFGVSQVLPIVVEALFAPEGSTLVLEQPEIHLHPAVQANLADFLCETAHERKLQFIIESHSEHFLRRLQLRLAKQLNTPRELGLYFCDLRRGGRGGAARLNGDSVCAPLQVDEFGNIANWPHDFFGPVADDLKNMLLARGRRRSKEPA